MRRRDREGDFVHTRRGVGPVLTGKRFEFQFRVPVLLFESKSKPITGFFWLLLGFVEILLGFTRFYLIILGCIGVLLGFAGFCWVLLGFTRFYWVLLGYTGFYGPVLSGNVSSFSFEFQCSTFESKPKPMTALMESRKMER